MRITTDLKAALRDNGNRAAARAQILLDHELVDGDEPTVPEQWIDDLITDWVAELRCELAEGRYQ